MLSFLIYTTTCYPITARHAVFTYFIKGIEITILWVPMFYNFIIMIMVSSVIGYTHPKRKKSNGRKYKIVIFC